MTKFFSITVLLLIIVSKTNSQPVNFKYDRVGNFKEGLAPVYSGKNVGYIDKTGKEVVPVIYEEDFITDEFTDGVAIVTLNKLSGFVDKTGKLIVPCEYKGMSAFSEGIAEAYKAEGKVGFINTQGKTIIPFHYSINTMYGGAKCISGMIPVRNSAGKYGYIDKTNKLIVPFLYEVLQNFSDGLAMVKRVYNGKISYLNTKGETVIAEKYDNGTLFKDGLAYVNIGAKEKSLYSGLDGGKWGVIDKTGKEIIPIEYDKIYEIKNGLTIVAMGKYPNEKKGLIGKDGKIILPVEYADIKILKDRIVANKLFIGPYALFNYSGKQLGDFTWHLFDIFPDYAEGLLRVQELNNNKLGKVGAIDANGILKIPFIYGSIGQFYEGLATVSIDNKYGAIDKIGKIVIPLQYESLNSFSEGWASVYKNGKWGFINKAGKLMEFSKSAASPPSTEKKPAVSETYQHKENFFGFFVVVNGAIPSGVEGESTGGKFGILSKDDKVIIPAKYDWISIDTGNKAFYVQTGIKVFFSTKGTRTEPTSDTRIGILNYEGKQLFPPTLSSYSIRPNKHILVKDAITLKWGVLNTSYKSVVPFNYDLIYNFSDSGMAAKKNGKFGVINLKNETLVAFEYDSVYSGGNKAPGGYQLKKNGSSIWVNAKGKIIENVTEPTKTSNGNVGTTTLLVDENFDDNNNKWSEWDNEGSAAQLVNGNYRVTIKDNKNYACWLKSVPDMADQSIDFAIETKIFLHSTDAGNINDSYWLLWGVGNNGKDFYTLGIYPSGKFQYGKQVNGQWDGKAGSITSTAINAGVNKANVLRVEKRKNEIFFFVNGTEVYKTKYESFDKNYNGVGFQWNNKKLLDIDYLKIYRGIVSNVAQSPEPHENNYQMKLADASNSTDRANALIDYYLAVKPLTPAIEQLENLLGKKFLQMVDIDFHGFYEVLMSRRINFDDVKLCMKASEVLTTEQRSAVKLIANYTVEDFQATQNNTAKPAYPRGVPQPGYGWGKTVSSNKITNSNTGNTNPPTVISPPKLKDELTILKEGAAYLQGQMVYLFSQKTNYFVPNIININSISDVITLVGIGSKYSYSYSSGRNEFGIRSLTSVSQTIKVRDLLSMIDRVSGAYIVTQIGPCGHCSGQGGSWNNQTRKGSNCSYCSATGCVPTYIWNNGSSRSF